MNVTDLPTELLQEILERAQPDEFESLALSCRKLYSASSKYRAKHNDLRKLYPKDFFSYSGRVNRMAPWDLLYEISNEPLAARYLSRLQAPLRPYSPIMPMYASQDEAVERERLRHMAEYAVAQTYSFITLAGEDPKEWVDILSIKQYFSDWREQPSYSLAFLLMICPNVETLLVTQHLLYDSRMKSIQKMIETSVASKALSLPSLHTLAVSGSAYPYVDLSSAAPFVRIPSLKRVIFVNCQPNDGTYEGSNRWPVGPNSCSAETLELTTSLELSWFSKLLGSFSSLKRFCWHYTQCIVDAGYFECQYRIGYIVQAMLHSPSLHTLEHLTLTAYWAESGLRSNSGASETSKLYQRISPSIISKFSNLRSLDVSVTLLFGIELPSQTGLSTSEIEEAEKTVEPLVDMLPMSIEEVMLVWEGSSYQRLEVLRYLLAGFVEERMLKVPNLRKLVLMTKSNETSYGEMSEFIADLQTCTGLEFIRKVSYAGVMGNDFEYG